MLSHKPCRKTLCWLATASMLSMAVHGAHAASPVERVAAAALQAQQLCQMKLHHDADEFVECMDDLLKAQAKNKAGAATQLGTEYFGWVGALNSARMSLPGAMEAADRYLRRFRRTQLSVKLDDETLCKTIPGNCVQRIARMKEMEAQPPLAGVRMGAH